MRYGTSEASIPLLPCECLGGLPRWMCSSRFCGDLGPSTGLAGSHWAPENLTSGSLPYWSVKSDGGAFSRGIDLCVGVESVTTSRPTHFLSEIEAGNVRIPPGKLAYFQERLRNRIYNFVISRFFEAERNGLTKALLARRLGSDPAVVSRLLGAPGNWTLDTVSNLLLGIAAEELKPASSSVLNRKPRNFLAPEWLQTANLGWIAESQAQTPRQVPIASPGNPHPPSAGIQRGPDQRLPQLVPDAQHAA
jgi:hypothetical protein